MEEEAYCLGEKKKPRGKHLLKLIIFKTNRFKLASKILKDKLRSSSDQNLFLSTQ